MELLAILTVSPIRMLYPNRAPGRWRTPVLVGGILWAVLLLAMLPSYPRWPVWLVLLSLLYPLAYLVASLICDYRDRQRPVSP